MSELDLELELIGINAPWRLQAACRGRAPRTDPDHERHPWYPEWGESMADAKRTCNSCPVRLECLAFAIRVDERHGIWGGLSPIQRKQVRQLLADGVPLLAAMLQAQAPKRRRRRTARIEVAVELVAAAQ